MLILFEFSLMILMRFPSIDDYDAANAVNVDCWFAEWIGWLSMQVVCSQAWTGNAVTPQLQQPAGWTLDRIVENSMDCCTAVPLYHCTTVPLPGEQRSTGRGSGTGGTLDAWQESGATSNGHAANDFWTQRHLLVHILLHILLHLLLHLLVHHRNLHDHLHQDLLQVMPPGERGNTLPMASGHNLLEQNDIWTSKS